MAILFEWYETPVPNNETDETEKTTIHARITLNGKVGTDEIRRKIQKRSSLTETDVSAVLDALSCDGRGIIGRAASTPGWYRLFLPHTEK